MKKDEFEDMSKPDYDELLFQRELENAEDGSRLIVIVGCSIILVSSLILLLVVIFYKPQ